jgi:asparagine synthase (glutamine-hydrolysing)
VLRFIALVWDASHAAGAVAAQLASCHAAVSAQWQTVAVSDGLLVLYRSVGAEADEAQVLPHRAGVVLGRIFRKTFDEPSAAQSVTLDAKEAVAIVRSDGRDLTDRYWGRYVAFLRDEADQTTHVLRDPSGHMPCFSTAFRGMTIYFSHAQDCVALGLMRFSINWRYVAAYMCNWRLHNRQTGLNEISEVRAGECVAHRSNTVSTQNYWQPVEIARQDPVESFDAAVTLLRNTTRACVWAWASCYPRIIHSLSGGLDSSIVLSCLCSAPSRPAITCLHYFGESTADADERRFARMAAERWSCELVERKLDAAAVQLESILHVAKSARPGVYQYSVQHGSFEEQLAQRTGATAVFKGIGGDQVFFQGRGTLAVADYLHGGALRKGWQLAKQVAQVQRASIGSVFATGLLHGLTRRWNPLAELGGESCLVKPDVIEAVRNDKNWLDDWIASDTHLPEGKLRHIEQMRVPFDYYDPLDRLVHAQRVHPLLSQPLIEACLRIPTYFMAFGGRDRAAERAAFASDLPRAIASRSTKGALDSYMQQLQRRNLPFIKSMMLDGLLVREGLLDRASVEASFNAGLTSSRPLSELFVYHLSTEAWLRSWSTA